MGGAIALLLIGVVFIYIYFLPSIVASKKQHADKTSILVLNLLLGWLLIPWVIALVWAYKQAPVVVVTMAPPAPPIPPANKVITELASDLINKRLCPFCAEEIKNIAIRCKHCQADLSEAKVLA